MKWRRSIFNKRTDQLVPDITLPIIGKLFPAFLLAILSKNSLWMTDTSYLPGIDNPVGADWSEDGLDDDWKPVKEVMLLRSFSATGSWSSSRRTA